MVTLRLFFFGRDVHACKRVYIYLEVHICVLLYKKGRYNHLYINEFIDENSEACAIKSKYQAELHLNRDICMCIVILKTVCTSRQRLDYKNMFFVQMTVVFWTLFN